jgi:hypothetical protein
MTYPDGIDALVNVNATDTLAGGGHAARHNSVNTALVEIKNMLGPSPAGKIIQIVRATDSTARTTTSTTFVDVTGMSVTITPQKNSSAILIIAVLTIRGENATTDNLASVLNISDSSNNSLTGSAFFGTLEMTRNAGQTGAVNSHATLIAYNTPGTTDPTTYKLRFRSSVAATTTTARNNQETGQMYAIEVSA